MAKRTRAQIINDLNFRLANETRSGTNRFWTDADLHECITAALLRAEPLGNPVIVEMDRTGYLATPQVPAEDIVHIREVQVVAGSQNYADPPVYKLGAAHFRLNRYAPDGRYLWLNNPPAVNDVLRIHCVEAYDLTETDGTFVVADNDMIINYAMAAAYQRFLQNSQVEGIRGEFDLMLAYEQKGDMRKQRMEFMVYPEMLAPQEKGKK